VGGGFVFSVSYDTEGKGSLSLQLLFVTCLGHTVFADTRACFARCHIGMAGFERADEVGAHVIHFLCPAFVHASTYFRRKIRSSRYARECLLGTHTHTHTRQDLLIENFKHFDILDFNKLYASRGRRQAHPWHMCCSCCTVPRSPAGSIEFGSSSSKLKQDLDAARGTCCTLLMQQERGTCCCTLLAHAADAQLTYICCYCCLTHNKQ
jgi:hypothetical protein